MPAAARLVWMGLCLAACGSTQLQLFPSDGAAQNCVPVVGEARVSRIDSGVSYVTGEVRVVDGRVYAEHAAPSDAGGTDPLELFGFDPRGGEPVRVTNNAFEDRLVDARDGAFLYWQRYTDRDSRLVYRDDRGEVILAENPAYLGGTRFFSTQRVRMVRRGRAAFASRGVYVYDGQRTILVQGPEAGSAQQPDIGDDGTIAWLLYPPSTASVDLYVYSGGQVRRAEGVRSDRPGAALAVGAGHVYVTAAAAVLDYEVATGVVRMIAPGHECSALSAAGSALLIGCGVVSASTGLEAGATTVHLWDGQTLRDAPTLGGFVYALRLSGERAAWLEYPAADSLCQPTGSGKVVLWPGGRGAPRTIAEVGTPCLCCNAYWPPPMLDLAGDVVAWNYFKGDTTLGPAAPLGMAAVAFSERCASSGR